ncbi:MAG: hypothetical protein R2681_06375, partial [Pyrinomonadaceae bacterium]
EKTKATVDSGRSIGPDDAAQNMRAGKIVLNDAATNFVLEAFTQNHKDIGWYPEPQLTVLGEVPGRSGIRYSIRKSGKEVYSHRCELNTRKKTQRCFDNKKYVAGTGIFEVEVYFIDGDSGDESLLRKLKIDVHRAAKFKDAPADYYAQRHADAAVGYISVASTGRLTLHTFHVRDQELDKQFGFSPFLRCNANGQPIEFNNPGIPGKFDSLAYAVMTVPGKNPSGFKDPISFVRKNSELPLAINGNDTYFYDPSKNPGKWECRIMGNGDRTVYRTFSFEIAGDGKITPHPEQQSGNVYFGDNETMVEVGIPEGGSTLDQRLLPQPDAGFFYGIPWTTPEGKAAAQRVPNKGKPYPVP